MDGEQVTCPEVTGGTNGKDTLQRCGYFYKSEKQMRKFCTGLEPSGKAIFFPLETTSLHSWAISLPSLELDGSTAAG